MCYVRLLAEDAAILQLLAAVLRAAGFGGNAIRPRSCLRDDARNGLFHRRQFARNPALGGGRAIQRFERSRVAF